MNAVHRDRVFPFPEEEKAKELLDYLSWVAPLVTFLASIADLGLVVLYQKSFHPWRRIPVEAGEGEGKEEQELEVKNPTFRRMTSSEQYQETKRESVSDPV